MGRERQSLQDLIRSRQQSGFVGRQGQLAQYQENLGFPAEDERRRFLLNIHGNAGVGKTYLTKQLRQIANDHRCLTAYVDDTVDDATSAMVMLAEEFSRAGMRLSEFEKRAAAYRERRQELERALDGDAPDGVAAFFTKAAVTIGLAAARDIPFAGSLLAPVDQVAAAEHANRARAYLARKFSDHADVRLLMSPVDELTPVFVSGISRIAGNRLVALFIDTYERTGLVLDAVAPPPVHRDSTATCRRHWSRPSPGRSRLTPTCGAITFRSLPGCPAGAVQRRRGAPVPGQQGHPRRGCRSRPSCPF